MIELVGYIRVFSQHGRLVTAEQIAAVAGLEWDCSQTVSCYISLILNRDYADIQMRLSGKDHYFYSEKYIVERYAEQWLALNRGEELEAIAAQIRRNSCRHTAVFEESVLTFAPTIMMNLSWRVSKNSCLSRLEPRIFFTPWIIRVKVIITLPKD